MPMTSWTRQRMYDEKTSEYIRPCVLYLLCSFYQVKDETFLISQSACRSKWKGFQRANWKIVQKGWFRKVHWYSMNKAPSNKSSSRLYELYVNIFLSPRGCGKSHLVFDLIEKEYKKHYEYIISICSNLR